MKSTSFRHLGLVVGLSLFVRIALGDEDLKARFLKEAPSAWQRYATSQENLDVILERTTEAFGNAVGEFPTTKESYHVMKSANSHMKEETHNDGSQNIVGRNPAYDFVLNKSAGESSYVVRYVGKRVPGFEDDYRIVACFSTLALSGVGGVPLLDIIRRPNFHLKGVGKETRHGKHLVRVDFDYDAEDYLPLQGGQFWLDPSAYWLVSELEYRVAGQAPTTIENEFREKDEGPPILVRTIETTHGVNNPDGGTRWTSVISRWDREPLSPERFTLSAYGLPEIDLRPPGRPSSQVHYWWLGGAVVCAFAAAGLAFARRRGERGGTA